MKYELAAIDGGGERRRIAQIAGNAFDVELAYPALRTAESADAMATLGKQTSNMPAEKAAGPRHESNRQMLTGRPSSSA